jgi:hypothetical protein
MVKLKAAIPRPEMPRGEKPAACQLTAARGRLHAVPGGNRDLAPGIKHAELRAIIGEI